jgi:hypothetical protein
VYSLEFNSRGILTKPILLNKLQLASQAFNDNSFNPVGTGFGVDLFPYKKNGIYFDYKSKNPFSIYKESTPYLYLTKTSGIEVRGELNILENRGLSLPINKELSTAYKVNAMQLWIRYDKETFTTTPTELFEINHKDGTLKFYIQANSLDLDRGKIFVLDETGVEYNGVAFYLNGSLLGEDTTNTFTDASFTNSTRTYFLGAANGTPSNPISMSIAHVMWYSASLSAADVLQNYNALKSRYGI